MVSEETFHWGADAVDPRGADLPGLKAKFLLDHMPDTGTVLEIGCGDGKLLRTLARFRTSLDLHGCDVRAPTKAPDQYVFHKMGDDVPFADASVDVVLVFDVLEHVPRPRHTLAEAARVLRPGGKMLAFIPIEGERLSFYELYRRTLGADVFAVTKEHIQAFTHAGLRALVAEHFTVSDRRYAYHFLGQLMDASFFAAQRLSAIRKFWWKDNVYYNGENAERSAGSTVLNKVLQLGNLAAWAESTALGATPFGAAGILLEARTKHA